MRKIFKDNLKRITALLLVGTMVVSSNTFVFAEENDTNNDNKPAKESAIEVEKADEAEKSESSSTPKTVEDPVTEEEDADKVEETGENNTPNPAQKPALMAVNASRPKALMLGSAPESDEAAREKECISNYEDGASNPDYLKKFLTYLSLKYPEIGIDPQYGTGDSDNITKMKRQNVYDTIEIDGHDYPDISKNMVQFRCLGSFGQSIGSDEHGASVYNDTVKTLIIRNVDEIRNLYVPASVETLIIENTTLNCYAIPGFQEGMLPGDLKYCKNLKELVLKNVKFGDKYKNPEPEISEFATYQYEKNYKINLQDCPNLEKLEIDVSFDGAEDIQLAIDGGADNLFPKLTAANCKINPAPGTGYGQVKLYANPDSNLAKCFNSSETVKFKSELFRLWLLNAIGVDSNRDGVISQAELDAIESLEINDQTAHYASQTSLSDFQELADIKQMHGLKTLKLDFYDPSYTKNENRQTLYGIDFPDSLENLSMKNIYWEKDTQTKSHDNADIILTNIRTLEINNTDVNVGSGESYFNHSTQIKLTDTEGVLKSCIIENTDVESIELINNSNGKGIDNATGDEKQRIRFSAANCQNLKTIEFLGEGYAVEGSLDLTNDTALTHIGVPNEGRTQWTVYGEFDSTYAPVNVILNSCSNLGSDCNETVIDYDFINRRDLNVQALDTGFSNDRKLTIFRNPRIPGDTAGNVYLSCDSAGSNVWVYNEYNGKTGFIIENRSSFPTIAVFSNGQRIRTSGEGNHNNGEYTEDSDRWVERWDLVMSPKGYSNDFGNLTFYVVDKTDDGAGNHSESLRKVFYKDDVYVEWDGQNTENSIITLPTEFDATKNAYKLKGTKLSSTGIPGEVELKLYVYNADGTKSYIGYQNIKVYKMPSSVELVNDGTMRGSGTKDDPYIVGKNEELKLKARLLVKNGENTEVDRTGDYALRDVFWRIKEYDETPKYTSDSDGYSLYTLDSATRAGIDVVRGQLNSGETEEQYDRRTDAMDSTYYSHRRFAFNTTGSKFKIVAQSPYKYNSDAGDLVITSEVYVVCNNSNNPGGGSSGGENPGGENSGSEKPSGGNSSEENSGSGNTSQSAAPVYTVSAGTIPVYSTIPIDPVKDPEKPTLGLPVIEKKNPGVYVIPDLTKNEVVYMAPPVDNTKKTINIPDKIVINGQVMSVVKIDPGAFKNNENIETITIGKNIKVIGSGAFEGATNLKKITLGKNVEIIGDGAFKGCTKLTTITIPGKTTKIGASAFEGDTKLRNITIGKNVESIGDFAFKDCTSLTSISLPGKITNIGVGAFDGCIKLKTLKIISKKLTSIGVAFGAFYGLTERTTISVPKSLLNTYKGLFEEKGIISTVKIKKI